MITPYADSAVCSFQVRHRARLCRGGTRTVAAFAPISRRWFSDLLPVGSHAGGLVWPHRGGAFRRSAVHDDCGLLLHRTVSRPGRRNRGTAILTVIPPECCCYELAGRRPKDY